MILPKKFPTNFLELIITGRTLFLLKVKLNQLIKGLMIILILIFKLFIPSFHIPNATV